MQILVVSTEYDPLTRLISDWAKDCDCDSILSGKDATRENFEKAIPKFDGVVIFSHTSNAQIMGSDDKPLLDLENVEILKDKHVFLVVCDSSALLNLNIYSTIVGFKEPFIIDVFYSNIFKNMVLSICKDFYKDTFSIYRVSKEVYKILPTVPELTKMHILYDLNSIVIKKRVGSTLFKTEVIAPPL